MAAAVSSLEISPARCSRASSLVSSQLTTPRKGSSGPRTPGSIDVFDDWPDALQACSSASSTASWSPPEANSNQRQRGWPTQRLSISELSEAERMTPERLAERGLGFPWQQAALCTVDLATELTDKCREFCLVPTPELGKKCLSSGSSSPIDRSSPGLRRQHVTACTLDGKFAEQGLEKVHQEPPLCSMDLSPQLADIGRDFCLLPTPELSRTLKSTSSSAASRGSSPKSLQQRFATCTYDEPHNTEWLPSYHSGLTTRDSSVQSLHPSIDAQMHCVPNWLGNPRMYSAEVTSRSRQAAAQKDIAEQTNPLLIMMPSPSKVLPPQKRLRAQTRAGGA